MVSRIFEIDENTYASPEKAVIYEFVLKLFKLNLFLICTTPCFSVNFSENTIDVYCVCKDLHLYLISGTRHLYHFVFHANNVIRLNHSRSLHLEL